MKHCGTKQIETSRLILRRFELSDASALYDNWASDPKVTKYLMWPTHTDLTVSEKVLKDWVDSYQKMNYYHWAIVLKGEGNRPIGCIGAVDSNEMVSMLHIGYCIGSQWWHQGITSDALKAVIDFLFEEVGALRIESRHDPHNPNSGSVMKKCGMKYEGTLRNSDWNNQGICDASYYSILKSEWRK